MRTPTALIRSAEMMLRHLGEDAAAEAVRQSLREVYADPATLTPDLGGSASTSEFGATVAARVREIVG